MRPVGSFTIAPSLSIPEPAQYLPLSRTNVLALRVMMKKETFEIARIYVPVKRRATLEQSKVDEIAASILANGLLTPILVRPDGDRYVLVEGLHRLEAARSLGEATIAGYRVSARKH